MSKLVMAAGVGRLMLVGMNMLVAGVMWT